ncbi:MAG TPA: hypothetical protein PKN96_09570, partial [Flavobacterium sp.]|nr:hypothetical protein [Flavobacterium sp.]
INRFKPMMHCNGKCQLYRQLKKAADEEAENNRLPMAVLKIKTLDTFIDAAPQWHWDVVTVDKVSCLFFTTTESVLYGYSLSLLKPPQLTT